MDHGVHQCSCFGANGLHIRPSPGGHVNVGGSDDGMMPGGDRPLYEEFSRDELRKAAAELGVPTRRPRTKQWKSREELLQACDEAWRTAHLEPETACPGPSASAPVLERGGARGYVRRLLLS